MWAEEAGRSYRLLLQRMDSIILAGEDLGPAPAL
jgi:hypothetical protein